MKSSILLALCLGLSGSAAFAAAPAVVGTPCATTACGKERLVYFGTRGTAVFAARLNEDSGALTPIGPVATIDRPTWIIASPHAPVLYAVSETGNDGHSDASISSLAVDRATGTLTQLSKVTSGGGGATFLADDPRSHSLFVANYGTGHVSVLPVEKGGVLRPPASIQAEQGSGPSPRQKGPHAHGVALDPSGRYLLSADLGADRIFVYRFDPATRQLSPGDPASLAMPAGSGPRHLTFHPNGRLLFVNTELTGTITALAWDAAAGRLRPLETISAYSADYAGEKSTAELVVSADGRFLYVSTRGDDAVSLYAIDVATGGLTSLQRVPSGGKGPWSFGFDPSGRWLLVTNALSDAVTVLAIDPKTGHMRATGISMTIPHPSSVAFPIGG